MGYRSDLVATFYVKDAKHFPVVKLWLDENFPMEQLGDSIRWFDRGMLFEAQHVKWYDDYNDVKAFNAAVDKYLELVNAVKETDDTPTFLYEFVRLGENYEDIDTEYEGFACEYLLSVNREIICEV